MISKNMWDETTENKFSTTVVEKEIDAHSLHLSNQFLNGYNRLSPQSPSTEDGFFVKH